MCQSYRAKKELNYLVHAIVVCAEILLVWSIKVVFYRMVLLVRPYDFVSGFRLVVSRMVLLALPPTVAVAAMPPRSPIVACVTYVHSVHPSSSASWRPFSLWSVSPTAAA